MFVFLEDGFVSYFGDNGYNLTTLIHFLTELWNV